MASTIAMWRRFGKNTPDWCLRWTLDHLRQLGADRKSLAWYKTKRQLRWLNNAYRLGMGQQRKWKAATIREAGPLGAFAYAAGARECPRLTTVKQPLE
jgi:hypothetical protein